MLNRKKTTKCGSFTYFVVQLAPTSYGGNAVKNTVYKKNSIP
jgi:hypothetical protein